MTAMIDLLRREPYEQAQMPGFVLKACCEAKTATRHKSTSKTIAMYRYFIQNYAEGVLKWCGTKDL
jgi:hypothetical protein